MGFESRNFDEYLLESLRRCHEPGWEDLADGAFRILPARLGLKRDAGANQRFEELCKLHDNVFGLEGYGLLEDVKQRRLASDRYHRLWGSLCFETYQKCQQAMTAEVDQKNDETDKEAN